MSLSPPHRTPDSETQFEDRFEGTWRKRWWQIGPPLVHVDCYTLGKLTGDIIAVEGMDDEGRPIRFKVRASTRSLPGYRRTTR